MFFYLPVFLYSLVFLAVLELANYFKFALESFAGSHPRWFVVIILFGTLGITLSYKRVVKKITLLVVPLVFSLSACLLLYLADLKLQEQLLIMLSTAMFYFSMLGAYRLRVYPKDKTARGLVAASLAATIFFFYDAMNGLYINFPIPLWFMMIMYLFVTAILSYEFFNTMENVSKRMAWLYGFLIGLAMSEILFMMSFWPFTYLTTGAIAVIFYYVLWDLAQCYFLCKLSQKRMIMNMIFLGSLIGLILISTRWLTVV